MNKTLYVIIVTYNGMKWLERCLNSVRNATIPAEIIVIDNCSTDGSVEYIRDHFPMVKLIRSEKNLGFGKANNLGIEIALNEGAEYVYLLNQDAWVKPETFETLMNLQRENPEYGILSPMQVDASEVCLDKRFEDLSVKKSDAFLNDVLFGKVHPVYAVKFVMAAHWLLSRRCLLDVGGFSPVFPHYGEDNDFLSRAGYMHFKAGYSPLCLGIHNRENRPEPLPKMAYMTHIKFLTETANINHSASICLNLLKQTKSLVPLLWKMRSIRGLENLWMSLKKIPLIYRSRKIVKSRGPSFLHLNGCNKVC